MWHDASGAPSRTSVGAEEEPEPEADSEPEVAEDAEDAAGAADAATRHSATRMSFIIVLRRGGCCFLRDDEGAKQQRRRGAEDEKEEVREESEGWVRGTVGSRGLGVGGGSFDACLCERSRFAGARGSQVRERGAIVLPLLYARKKTITFFKINVIMTKHNNIVR